MLDHPISAAAVDDSRLHQPQCFDLSPVKTLHENPWFVVQNRGGYYTVEYHRPQVIVLPVVDNHSIVMVKVKRPVIADAPIELPAGSLKSGETPRNGAARELFEETGILVQSHRLSALSPMANSPNRNPQLLYVFQVNLTEEEYEDRGRHDHEIEDVLIYDFPSLHQMIHNGQIYISVPLAIITRFLLHL